MAKKKVSILEDDTKVQVSVKDLIVGDEIYVYNPASKDHDVYTVLDVGDPFILIEDKYHFANLYRVSLPIYKNKN